ncbi:putative membrane-spanning protein, partial [Tai Forest reovirus]
KCFISRTDLQNSLEPESAPEIIKQMRIRPIILPTVNWNGRLITSGTVGVSFDHPVYSRIIPSLVATEVYTHTLSELLKLEKNVDEDVLRRVQRAACTEVAYQYIARISSLYRVILENYPTDFVWAQAGELVYDEVFLLPALYEIARDRAANVLMYEDYHGCIGGRVAIDGDRNEGMRRLFVTWLHGMGQIQAPEYESVMDPEYKVVLERDYKVFFLGDSLPRDGDLGWLHGKMPYRTVWMPNASYSRMVRRMLLSRMPSGAHGVLNIPIPHYFEFDCAADLELRCWHGVRATWLKLFDANVNGEVDDCRLNEALMVNCPRDLSSAVRESMFSCSLARGVPPHVVSTLKSVKMIAGAQHYHVVQGDGDWWRREDIFPQGRYSIRWGEIIAIRGIDEGIPDRFASWIEVMNPIYYTDIGLKANQLMITVPTDPEPGWIEVHENDLKFKVYQLDRVNYSVDPVSSCATIFFSQVQFDLPFPPPYELDQQRDAVVNRELYNAMTLGSNRQIGEFHGKIASTTKKLRDLYTFEKDRTVPVNTALNRKDAKENPLEYLCVEAWIEALRTVSDQMDYDPRWAHDDQEQDDPRYRLVDVMIRVSKHLWSKPYRLSMIANATLLIHAIARHLLSFNLAHYDGLRLEDLTIAWYGEGAEEMTRLMKECGFKRYIPIPNSMGGADHMEQHVLRGQNKKVNVTIMNYPLEWVDGVDRAFIADACVLLRIGEIGVLRARSGVENYFVGLSAVLRDGFLDIFRIGMGGLPSDFYFMWIKRGPDNFQARDAVFRGTIPFGLGRRFLPNTYDHQKVGLREWISDALLGDFHAPICVEMDLSEGDLERGFYLIGAITKSFRVRCFSRGALRIYRATGTLDIDATLRNVRMDGDRISVARGSIRHPLDLVRTLTPGSLSPLPYTFKVVNSLNALQSVTFMLIKEWLRRELNMMDEGRVILFDVGGRRGELSGWVSDHQNLRYICIDPAAGERIPKGEVLMNEDRTAPHRWDFRGQVDEQVDIALRLCGEPNMQKERVFLVFSNVASNVFERYEGADEPLNNFMRQLVNSDTRAFVRDMSTLHGNRNGANCVILRSKFCRDFVFDARRGYIPAIYPEVGTAMHYAPLQEHRNQIVNWTPTCREIMDAMYARGLQLDSFSEMILPIMAKHTFFLSM